MHILTLSQIIEYVMASTAEAKLAVLYITACEMIPLLNALKEMGWPQPKTQSKQITLLQQASPMIQSSNSASK